MKQIIKITYLFSIALLLGCGVALAQDPNPDAFITVWEPTGTSIKYPGIGNDYTIVVRELASNTVVQTIPDASSVAGTPYPITGLTPGVRYAIEVVPNGIRATDFNGFRVLQGTEEEPDEEKLNLLEITQWGAIEWNRTSGLIYAFLNCKNLELTATDKPVFTTSPQNLSGMFQGCSNLTGVGSSISEWDMTNVSRIAYMFMGAVKFNQPLNNWNVSGTFVMIQAFFGAESFDQNLGSWQLPPNLGKNAAKMFDGSGMSGENYAATLIGWANNPATPNDVVFGADSVCFDKSATAARTKLIEEKGWTITDAGDCDTINSGVEFISTSKFSLTRNPVEENACFVFEPSSIGDKIIIADLSGKIIAVKSIAENNRTEINIPFGHLPKGVYVAMYKDVQGKQSVVKLIK